MAFSSPVVEKSFRENRANPFGSKGESMGMAKKGKEMPKMPPKGKYKSTMNEYDSRRPKRPLMTRIAK